MRPRSLVDSGTGLRSQLRRFDPCRGYLFQELRGGASDVDYLGTRDWDSHCHVVMDVEEWGWTVDIGFV